MPPRKSLLGVAGQRGESGVAADGGISAMTVVTLRAKLKENGLSTSGNKAQLVDRLRGALPSQRDLASSGGTLEAQNVSAQVPEDGLTLLLAMGFSREAAVHALAVAGGDAATAAEALAESTLCEPPRKRRRQASPLNLASFSSSSVDSVDSSRRMGTARSGRYRRPPVGIDDRIDRALSQRLYLLERRDDASTAESPSADFMVLGSTGNVYKVQINGCPCCDCPDFVRRQSPCKHVLFVWLRVLRLDPEDPRIWQKRLRPVDIADVLQCRRATTSGSGVHAPKDVKKRYDQVMGIGSVELGVPSQSNRLRKALDEDECPICYEAMDENEESGGLVTFCSCCGSNLHKDCMARWQKASKKGDCPFCREPFRAPCNHVAPGSALPVAPKSLARESMGYLNLLGEDDEDF